MKRNYFLLLGIVMFFCSLKTFASKPASVVFAEETEDTIVFRDAFTEEDIAQKFENYTENVVAFDSVAYYDAKADSEENLKCEGRVVGVVYDENTGDFLVNAEVSFEELDLSVSTGEGGRFDIVNLPDGRYTIIVHADGYQDAVYQNMPVCHSVGVDIYSLALSKKHDILKDFDRVANAQESMGENFGEMEYAIHNDESRSVSAIPTIPKVTVGDGKEICTYTNNLNHYLYYVVASELLHPDDSLYKNYSKSKLKEGFKAQAVASRTYAVAFALIGGRHSEDGYDLCTKDHCQVYNHNYCNLVTIEAVDETENEVVYDFDNDRVCGTFFFASCKGHTKSYIDVWGGGKTNISYLVSVDCPYDLRPNLESGGQVGMCQDGAIGMSVTGCLYEEILEHYYYMTTVITANPYTD